VWPLTTTSIAGEKPSAMGTIGPCRPVQSLIPAFAACVPPSCRSTTIASTPCFCSSAAYRLPVSISSRNSSPATPDCVTMSGVPSRVMPMNPMRTPATSLTAYGASSGSPVSVTNALAERYWNSAPL
jgi:hypothetical protein